MATNESLTSSTSEQQEALLQQLAETTQALTAAAERIQALERRVQQAEERLLQQSVQADVEFLQSLTLPQELKAKYVELAQRNALGEHKALLFETLRAQSEAMRAMALAQHGDNSAENLTDASVGGEDGFRKALTDIIQRNYEVIKARQKDQAPVRGAYVI
jgi:hypothetical protein